MSLHRCVTTLCVRSSQSDFHESACFVARACICELVACVDEFSCTPWSRRAFIDRRYPVVAPWQAGTILSIFVSFWERQPSDVAALRMLHHPLTTPHHTSPHDPDLHHIYHIYHVHTRPLSLSLNSYICDHVMYKKEFCRRRKIFEQGSHIYTTINPDLLFIMDQHSGSSYLTQQRYGLHSGELQLVIQSIRLLLIYIYI